MTICKIPIDLVYTYVDGDQAHYEKRWHYEGLAENTRNRYKEAEIRFSNVGEIRFSVRSALKYMPWLRQIIIVTDSQKPPVDSHLIERGLVRIVDHKEFIPEKYLPTFNSMTIESFIHRIDGLSEIFLYNNDDFIHFSDVPEKTYIQLDNLGNVSLKLNVNYAIKRRIMHLISQLLPPYYATLLSNPHTMAISNAYTLLRNSQYNLPRTEIIVPRHFTHIYRKTTSQRLEEEFATQLETNRKLRFRTPQRFSYSTLAYTLECKWNQENLQHIPKLFEKNQEFWMFDFTALFVCRKKLWQRVSTSRAMFACLNNIPQSDKTVFERVMHEKGLGTPYDEPFCSETQNNVTAR